MKKLLLFIPMALILAALSGCVGEEEKVGLIYVADTINARVVILDSDLKWVDSFSGFPLHLVVDKNFIYINATARLIKYERQSPYAEVKQIDTPTFEDIDCDGDYIYGVDVSPANIEIRKKSDLSLLDNLDPDFFSMYSVAVDSDYIYCLDYNWIKKFKKSDHSLVDSKELTDPYGYWGMDKDDLYLYFCGGIAGESLIIHKKSDLSEYKVIPNLGQEHRGVCVQGDYAFMTDRSKHVIRKIKVSTGEQVAMFGEEGVTGDDHSHLNFPEGIAIGPEEEQEVIIALIG